MKAHLYLLLVTELLNSLISEEIRICFFHLRFFTFFCHTFSVEIFNWFQQNSGVNNLELLAIIGSQKSGQHGCEKLLGLATHYDIWQLNASAKNGDE